MFGKVLDSESDRVGPFKQELGSREEILVANPICQSNFSLYLIIMGANPGGTQAEVIHKGRR